MLLGPGDTRRCCLAGVSVQRGPVYHAGVEAAVAGKQGGHVFIYKWGGPDRQATRRGGPLCFSSVRAPAQGPVSVRPKTMCQGADEGNNRHPPTQ